MSANYCLTRIVQFFAPLLAQVGDLSQSPLIEQWIHIDCRSQTTSASERGSPRPTIPIVVHQLPRPAIIDKT